jgi:Raf kinase inhibitor-like YbhB/YbcL family protein
MKYLLLGLAASGCGHSDTKTVDAPGPDGTPSSSFNLTSSAFAEGGTIPTVSTCSGANTSPPLAWSGAPAGTQSFAVVLSDLSISLVHWVIYDIPPSAPGLPASVEASYAPSNVTGAHQTVSVQTSTVGYYGPCPSRPPPTHTYQFAVYALDVATLPGASQNTTRTDAIAAIAAHRVGMGTLTGMYTLP